MEPLDQGPFSRSVAYGHNIPLRDYDGNASIPKPFYYTTYADKLNITSTGRYSLTWELEIFSCYPYVEGWKDGVRDRVNWITKSQKQEVLLTIADPSNNTITTTPKPPLDIAADQDATCANWPAVSFVIADAVPVPDYDEVRGSNTRPLCPVVPDPTSGVDQSSDPETTTAASGTAAAVTAPPRVHHRAAEPLPRQARRRRRLQRVVRAHQLGLRDVVLPPDALSDRGMPRPDDQRGGGGGGRGAGLLGHGRRGRRGRRPDGRVDGRGGSVVRRGVERRDIIFFIGLLARLTFLFPTGAVVIDSRSILGWGWGVASSFFLLYTEGRCPTLPPPPPVLGCTVHDAYPSRLPACTYLHSVLCIAP
ncbi:hypothetical protein VTJ83DRAFT_6750 [Remersonia thermophila]|uniref:DUF7136 domain-containing protein n=1 Tax=Remersonia thermophila TaxID=72144 RepID=A0ABR4D6F2_9PEZI